MDQTLFHANERVDRSDLEAATGKLVLAELLRMQRTLILPSGRTLPLAGTSARLFGGFALSTVGGSATVTAGSGIVPYNDNGTLSFGLAIGDQSPASYTLDLSGAADGTYAIWIRFASDEADPQNRVFWNAAATPLPAEEIASVPTRKLGTWEAIFALASAGQPGIGEYVKVHQVGVVGGAITSSADYRHFIFEGSAADSYAQEWGSEANDSH